MKVEEIRALYAKFGLDFGSRKQTVAQQPPHDDVVHAATGGKGSGSRVNRADEAVVWKLRTGETLEPVKIRSGITDHTVTEVAELVNGNLQVDDVLVTAAVLSGPKLGPGVSVGGRH